MFDLSQHILKSMERRIVGAVHESDGVISNALDVIKATFVYPLQLLKVGFDHGLARDIVKFFFISTVVLMAVEVLLRDMDAATKTLFSNYLFLPAVVVLPLLLTIFPLPSFLANHSVSAAHVTFAATIIGEKGLFREEELELLRRNMQIFELRITKRINVLRAGLALLWTYLIYLSNRAVEAGPAVNPQAVADHLELFVFFAFILGYFALLDSYRKANDIIFRGIEFGANECSYRLLIEDRAHQAQP